MAKRKHAKSSRTALIPQLDLNNLLFLTMTMVAVMLVLAISLQTLLPSSTQANNVTKKDDISLISESAKQARPTQYHNGKPMLQDEDGIWRDAEYIRFDDNGRPFWLGNGLRKSGV